MTQQVDQAALEQAYACLQDYWKATSKTRKKRKAPAQLAISAQIKRGLPKSPPRCWDPLRDWPTTSSPVQR